MPWYGDDFWVFPPYVSAATKRALAVQALAKLVKKTGRKPEPIIAQQRRAHQTTFSGKPRSENLYP
jgi:hypothetical protein